MTNGTDPDLEQYFSFGNEKLVISEHFDKLCEEDIYQIMCSCSPSEYERILLGTHATQITAWWDKAVDIIPLSCGKGNAVRAVLAHEEEMDCWSNWIFPIFTSCFCVVLSKNIKEEQSNLKKNDAKEVSIMYKELSDYINKNNLKMSAMTFDDELLSNARKNSIMRNMISDYLMDALQEKRRLPIPITLKEVNEIMPKRSVGKGLMEARI